MRRLRRSFRPDLRVEGHDDYELMNHDIMDILFESRLHIYLSAKIGTSRYTEHR